MLSDKVYALRRPEIVQLRDLDNNFERKHYIRSDTPTKRRFHLFDVIQHLFRCGSFKAGKIFKFSKNNNKTKSYLALSLASVRCTLDKAPKQNRSAHDGLT